jgi:hypothetical protein
VSCWFGSLLRELLLQVVDFEAERGIVSRQRSNLLRHFDDLLEGDVDALA